MPREESVSSSGYYASLRFVHAVQGGPNVDVYIDDQSLVDNLSFNNITAYLKVDSGKSTIRVKDSASGQTLLKAKVNLSTDKAYTIVVNGDLSNLEEYPLSGVLSEMSRAARKRELLWCGPSTVRLGSRPSMFTLVIS